MADNGSSTILLIVIAVATSIQTLMLMVAAAYALRGYRELTEQVDSLRRAALPMFDRAERVLDAIEDTTARARMLDDNVRHAVADTKEVARRTVARFKSDWWPVLATGKAAVAAIHAFRQPRILRSRSKPEPARARRAASEDEETRFVYEGGTHARS